VVDNAALADLRRRIAGAPRRPEPPPAGFVFRDLPNVLVTRTSAPTPARAASNMLRIAIAALRPTSRRASVVNPAPPVTGRCRQPSWRRASRRSTPLPVRASHLGVDGYDDRRDDLSEAAFAARRRRRAERLARFEAVPDDGLGVEARIDRDLLRSGLRGRAIMADWEMWRRRPTPTSPGSMASSSVHNSLG
jgi:hypothetical protein